MMYVEAFMALELITSFQVVQHVCVGVWVCGCVGVNMCTDMLLLRG